MHNYHKILMLVNLRQVAAFYIAVLQWWCWNFHESFLHCFDLTSHKILAPVEHCDRSKASLQVSWPYMKHVVHILHARLGRQGVHVGSCLRACGVCYLRSNYEDVVKCFEKKWLPWPHKHHSFMLSTAVTKLFKWKCQNWLKSQKHVLYWTRHSFLEAFSLKNGLMSGGGTS